MKEEGSRENTQISIPNIPNPEDESIPKVYSLQEKPFSTVLCSSNGVLSTILSEVQNMKTTLESRLMSMELQIATIAQTCSKISTRLDDVEKNQNELISSQQRMKCEISSNADEESDSQQSNKLSLIPSTCVSDYPNGSWLGDPKDSTKRVRCALPPMKLYQINVHCTTAMKMALTLLDHLFTPDILANSNLSGRSSKGKKQLCPLLVFGIKCHLQFKYHINDKDWSKICQSIDAKCRFIWKKRNLAMTNKRNEKRKILCSSDQLPEPKSRDRNQTILNSQSSTEPLSFDFDQLNHSNIDFNSCVKVITESPCELRIINATPAQIAQFQESQGIILAQEIGNESNDEKSILIDDSPDLSMNTVVMNADDDHLGPHLTIAVDSEEELKEAHQVETAKHQDDTSHLITY